MSRIEIDVDGLNIGNECCVGRQGEAVVFFLAPQRMSRDRALVLAAWIVAMGDDYDQFAAILARVQDT